MGHSSYHSTNKPDPTNPCNQQLHLLIDHRSLNKSDNMAHNRNSIMLYYILPNITDLLARLQNCTIFSSLYLRSGYHHINLTPEAKLKTDLPQVALECGSFQYMLSSGCFQLPYITAVFRVRFFCISQ